MTNEEAIETLIANYPDACFEQLREACDMAIEALRNEINCVKCAHYTERETYTGIKGVCKMDTAHREEFISRQDVKVRVNEYFLNKSYTEKMLKDDIKSLPSVELKTEWIPVRERLPNKEEREEYELAIEQMKHDTIYEPMYNSEDGSM